MIENYIVYEYNKNNNDIKLVKEFYNKNDAIEFLGITSIKHFCDYNTKDIENINCKLRQEKYFIFTEYINEDVEDNDNYNDLQEFFT